MSAEDTSQQTELSETTTVSDPEIKIPLPVHHENTDPVSLPAHPENTDPVHHDKPEAKAPGHAYPEVEIIIDEKDPLDDARGRPRSVTNPMSVLRPIPSFTEESHAVAEDGIPPKLGLSPRSRSVSALKASNSIDLNNILARAANDQAKVGAFAAQLKKRDPSVPRTSHHKPPPSPVTPDEFEQMKKIPSDGAASKTGSESLSPIRIDSMSPPRRRGSKLQHLEDVLQPDPAMAIDIQHSLDETMRSVSKKPGKSPRGSIKASKPLSSEIVQEDAGSRRSSNAGPLEDIHEDFPQIGYPRRQRRTCCECMCFGKRYTMMVEEERDHERYLSELAMQRVAPPPVASTAAAAAPRRKSHRSKASNRSRELDSAKESFLQNDHHQEVNLNLN